MIPLTKRNSPGTTIPGEQDERSGQGEGEIDQRGHDLARDWGYTVYTFVKVSKCRLMVYSFHYKQT